MRKEYDFSKAKRAKEVPHLSKLQAKAKGKTRISIMLDNDVIEAFRHRAEQQGIGYQTAINDTLRSVIGTDAEPLTEARLREVLREELRAV